MLKNTLRKFKIQNNAGSSLLEAMVAMSVGILLILGMVEMLSYFQKSIKTMRDLGDYNARVAVVASALQIENRNNCSRYLPKTENPKINTALGAPPTQLTLVGEPVPLGGAVAPENILIHRDGSRFNGNEYLVTLTTTDHGCNGNTSNPCKGTLRLVMNRLSPDPNQQLPEGGKSMRHFGLAQNSQEIAHVTFWVDPGGALESCDVITSKGVGAINYEAPFLTNNGTDGAPAQCDINQGYVSVSACGVQSAAPGPGYTYCNNTPSGPASVVGCARFGDINKVRLSKQHVSRQDKCDPGFVITGICSSASNACGSANIRCTSIENIRLVPNVNSADGFFCTRRTLKKGTLTNCNFGELMTEYCSEARCYPGYITCCGVLN